MPRSFIWHLGFKIWPPIRSQLPCENQRPLTSSRKIEWYVHILKLVLAWSLEDHETATKCPYLDDCACGVLMIPLFCVFLLSDEDQRLLLLRPFGCVRRLRRHLLRRLRLRGWRHRGGRPQVSGQPTIPILLNIFDLPREANQMAPHQGRYCSLLFLVATLHHPRPLKGFSSWHNALLRASYIAPGNTEIRPHY